MNPIRVMIADDHPQVRLQVRARLSREPGLEIAGEAAGSEQAIQCALDSRPHVILIDPIMSDGRGLVALGSIVTQLPHAAVVVLTAFADTAFRSELRKLGVRHILDKGIASERLVEIIRAEGAAANTAG